MQSSPQTWAPRPSTHANRPPGKGKGQKNPREIKPTSVSTSTSAAAPPRVPPAARTLAPTAAAADTQFLVAFNVLNRRNSGSPNGPTQQKEVRKGKEVRKAKANDFFLLLILNFPLGNPSSLPADPTCVLRRNHIPMPMCVLRRNHKTTFMCVLWRNHKTTVKQTSEQGGPPQNLTAGALERFFRVMMMVTIIFIAIICYWHTPPVLSRSPSQEPPTLPASFV